MTQADLNSEESLNVTAPPARRPVPFTPASPQTPTSPNAWMVTFTDLVALMLTFFVLLYSMSSLDLVKWQNLTGSLAQSLDSVEESSVVAPKAQLDILPVKSIPGTDLDYLTSVLAERLEAEETLRDAEFVNLGDRLVLSLSDALVFEPESSSLGEKAQGTVSALGSVFRGLSNSVEIVAYPIDEPSTEALGAEQEAVWTQALGRAIHLARLLEDTGYTGTIRPQGVAHLPTLGRGEATQESVQEPERGLQAAQRRFDIILLDTSGERS